MSVRFTRRDVLLGSAAAGAVACGGARRSGLAADPPPLTLRVATRQLEVLGRAATVYGIFGPRGIAGLDLPAAQPFDAVVANAIDETIVLHWHGQEPPAPEDGSPFYREIAPGTELRYQFPPRPGTHWVHSHHGLQEARLMATPMIVRTAAEFASDRQDVVLMLQDFSFTPPEEIYARLRAGADEAKPAPDRSDGEAMAMPKGMPMDLNDVDFDAYLANGRTLEDPEVVRVERGGRLRLRIINAASATNYHVDLGALAGTLVAVDGNSVQPITGTRFPLAVAQRLDLLLELPAQSAAWPILAQREGDTIRTGIVLATQDAAVAAVDAHAKEPAPPVAASDLEQRLRPSHPLAAKPADRSFDLGLTGEMASYTWGLALAGAPQADALEVAYGDRVAVNFVNQTGMAHPMHLHGHHFQVLGIGDQAFSGAMRDTVMVGPRQTVRIAFDALNPGEWPLHCHIAYHLEAGMITKVRYV